MGKKQKQREEKKQKKNQRINQALGLSSHTARIRNQNVSVPNIKKQKQNIIHDLSKKQLKGSRETLINSLKEKLAQTNPLINTYTNVYQIAEDSTANQHLYDSSRDLGLQSNKSDEKKINDFNKDNSHKAYMKMLNEVIENSDVILEVLDARDPLSCRSQGMESLIVNKNKRLIFVLNKIDLIPVENALMWQQFLGRENATILFKANTQNQSNNLAQAKLFDKAIKENKDYVNTVLKGNKAVGSEELLNVLKNYARADDIKTKIVVGVIGYPNVGKSSLINSLKRGKVVGVSNTPGFTKGIQEIILDGDIKLLDCPGVVFSKNDDNLLHNVIRTEDIKDPVDVVVKILSKMTVENVINAYGVDVSVLKGNEITADKLLYLIGEKLGKFKQGGLIDLDKAARIVINDWNQGKLKYFTVPPSVDKESFKALLKQNQDEREAQMKID